MRPEEARSLLQTELNLDNPPVIEISPNFVPWLWLPRRAASIEVVIASPEVADPEAEDGDPEGEGEADPADGDAEPTATEAVPGA